MSDLPNGWTPATLQDVATWSSGGTPSRSNPAYYSGAIPWFKTGELGSRVLYDSEEHISDDAVSSSSAKVFPKGSVAIAMYGATIGKTSIFGIDAATNQACAVGLPEAISAEFLYHFLVSQEKGFIDAGKGGAQPNISQGIVKAWPISVPPANEQTRIVEKLEELLSDLDAGVAELKAAQKKLGQYRQSLLKAAVEGALTADWRKQRSAPPLPNPSPARGEGLQADTDAALAPLLRREGASAFAPLPPCGGGAGGEGANTPTTEDEVWLQTRARELRKEQTPQEQALWQHLRAKRFAGYKFRRQQPLGRFIFDFVCFAQRLIVELDGGQHAEAAAYDADRDAWLKQQEFRVLRFWNNEWTAQPEAVLEAIWQALQQPPLPNPSPARGEGLQADTDAAPAPLLPRGEGTSDFAPLSPCGRGAGGEGSDETGAQLLARILLERRARWEAKQLAKFESQGKAPPKDWQTKYPEPVQPDTSDLPELPEGWVWAGLDQLVTESSYGTSVKCSYESNGIPVLRIPNVSGGSLDLRDMKFSTVDLGLDEHAPLVIGDVLVIRTNGSIGLVGRAAAVVTDLPAPHYFASYLLRLRCTETTCVHRWILAVLTAHTGRQWLEARAASSAGQHNISLSTLLTMPIPLPPLTEQISALTEVEAGHEVIKQQVEATDLSIKQSTAQRKNILKAAFSGQLVPQDPNDEPASVLLERIRAERAERDAVKKPRGRKTKEAV